MQLVPLIELRRADIPECLHFGAVAVVDRHGTLQAQAGDPHWRSFSRSTLKPLQALPFLEAGGPAHFGFGTEEIAMLCASHNGEDMHVARTEGMLRKVGLGVDALQCGCQVPSLYATLETSPPAGAVFDARHHNCSGKHAGFLAYCVQHGHATADYTDAGHPLQQAVRRRVARAVRMDEADLRMGIDGCSAPNCDLPLSHLAGAYARLASGAQDSEFGASFAVLSDAMTRHPELVSGTARSDLAFMRCGRGDWVTKVGADGVQAVASKSRGVGFAIKIIDANKPALFAATVEVLDQLGWMDDTQRAELAAWRAEPILNARGMRVGDRKAVFQLTPA